MCKKKKKIIYADELIGSYKLYRDPVKRRGMLQLFPGQDELGYGSKITTDICLQFIGEGIRRRVYCTCYSNAGSLWIVYKGKQVHLRTHFQSEIIEEQGNQEESRT
jgi:hypothetical protein